MGCNKNPPIGAVQTQDFICAVGDDFYEQLTIIDEITGQPEDITEWTFVMSVYLSWQSKQNGDDPLFTLENGTGFTIITPTEGRVDVAATSPETDVDIPLTAPYASDIPQNSCVYDIVCIDQNDLSRTRLRGNFVFQLRLSVT